VRKALPEMSSASPDQATAALVKAESSPITADEQLLRRVLYGNKTYNLT